LNNFTEELILHYEDTKGNTFFSQLINLKQKGTLVENIDNFQRLNIKVTNILDEHLTYVFIETIRDNIKHEGHLWEPNSLENVFRVVRNVENKILATRRYTTHNYKDESISALILPQFTKLTTQQLEEKYQKVFVTIVIANTIKVISAMRRNYYT